MRRRPSRTTRRGTVPVTLLAVLGVLACSAAAALAFWIALGAGAVKASVGTLAAPTAVTASATAGVSTVQVGWTGVTSPIGGAVDGYYVQRLAGATPSAACGSSLTTPLPATSCNDTNVLVGTYTYRVTTVFRSWTAVSSPSGAVGVTAPTVSVAAISSTPTNTQPLTYAVIVSEPVTDLAAGGVTVTAPAANTGVSKSVAKTDSQHFTVSVSGLQTGGTGDGTVSVSVTAGAVSDPAGNASTASNTAGVTWDRTVPTLVSLQMLDTNADGRVDQVRATFSETLVASTITAPWTLANVPSGGTLSSVSVSGAVATLTLTEGAGAADTSVGSFTAALATNASGIRDA
ncbi:MAG: hypothetical protein JWM18_856, partial [Chloroflexi bacterium]|nr:hypothetical protein [Chloroflexota bacterium]